MGDSQEKISSSQSTSYYFGFWVKLQVTDAVQGKPPAQ
jgi:hypothetical protein